jgi:hypothetical protein
LELCPKLRRSFQWLRASTNAWLEECLKEYRLRDGEHFDKEGQTEIIFKNHSRNLVKLCWINYRGGLQSYGQIKPGEKLFQATYANATWAVTDEKDKWLGYFIAGHEIASGIIPKK